MINEFISRVKNNPEGTIIGFGFGYIVSINVLRTDSVALMVALTFLGVVLGIFTQSKLKY